MIDRQAAARAEWQSLDVIVLCCVFRDAIRHLGRRTGCPNGQPTDPRGRREVGIQQRRRERQRAGLVVETTADVVGREELGRVDVERHQFAHGIGVLRAIQSMELRRTQIGLRVPIDLALQRRGECLHRGELGPRLAGRWHHAGAQFPQHPLGGARVFVRAARIEYLELQSALEIRVVVAVEAILVEKVPLRDDCHRPGGRGRRRFCDRESLRAARQRTGQQRSSPQA